jgi:hypothetical protein
MNFEWFLGIAFAVAIGYPLFRALLLRLSQPLRDRFADLGRKLLTDPTINEREKEVISSALDDAFDWRFLAYATFRFPVLAVTRRGPPSPEIVAFVDRPDVSEFIGLHVRSAMAANPIWAVLFLLAYSGGYFRRHGESVTARP